MTGLWQCLALGLTGAVLAVVLKGRSKEQAVLLGIGCCCLMGALAVEFLRPAAELADRLRQIGGLDEDLVTILWKVAGISLVTELAETVCTDAGESALGRMLRLCGAAAALYTALPLFSAVLELLEKLMGG